jgi:predicted RNase H-like HicB family nuclease
VLEHRTTHAVRCQCDNFRESLAFEVSEMGRMRISITVERLPEGVYLGTSAQVPGLTVECDTPEEAARAAEAVALDLLEDESGHSLDPRPEFVVVYKP